MKYVIYQQGARGYGRIARSLKFVNVINDIEDSLGLIFAGAAIIDSFEIPKNLKIIKLPTINKGLANDYSPLNKNKTLKETLGERTKLIKHTIKSFQPQIFFIDTIPTGVHNELFEVITWIKNSKNTNTKIVLITRDIIDEGTKTILEWKKYNVYKFLEAYYDMLFVFGSKKVFDFCKEYRLPSSISAKTTYCNFFSSKYFLETKSNKNNPIDILVTVGGGIDGFNLINALLEVYIEEDWNFSTKIILGHQLPKEKKSNLQKQLPPKVNLIDFTSSICEYIINSNRIVCMGGYNTLTEILALNKHPLVIPRTTPTKEQLIRAKLFQKLSLVTVANFNEKNKLKSYLANSNTPSLNNSSLIDFNLKKMVENNIKNYLIPSPI